VLDNNHSLTPMYVFMYMIILQYIIVLFQFQIIEKHVDNLLQNLPSLSEECELVTKQAQEINSRCLIV
jgi:hypothetical protein